MNPESRQQQVIADNEESLQTLCRAISMADQQFSPIWVCCNYQRLQQMIVAALREQCPLSLQEVILSESVSAPYPAIQAALGDDPPPPALLVFGLERLQALDQALVSLNGDRNEFLAHCPFPVLFWINEEIQPKTLRLAPDFSNWGTTVMFQLPPVELIEIIEEITEQVFAATLSATTSKFISNCTILGKHNLWEFRSGLKDLKAQKIDLPPPLEAAVQFVLGRLAYSHDQIEAALELYQESLTFWQQPAHPNSSVPNATERQGIVFAHLGLCYRRLADQHPLAQQQYWQYAKNSFQDCITCFEQAGRLDLVAQYINQLGEMLARLSDWDALEALSEKALNLHQIYGNQIQIAQDYAFIAKRALQQSRWQDAKDNAELSLSILAQSEVEIAQHPELFPFLWQQVCQLFFVKASRQLGYLEIATQTLLKAAGYLLKTLQNTEPHYDPQRYLRFLKILRDLYFEEGHYRAAFWIKEQQRSVEQQFGYSAFIGAGHLQTAQTNINPDLTNSEPSAIVITEIAASGRQQDVENLITKVTNPQNKLIVIYGPSGVGKTSLVQAGLMPALKQTQVRTRLMMPVVLTVYNDWVSSLGKSLSEALLQTQNYPEFPLHSTVTILECLRQNVERNFFTVLIFDQFEEFFFICTNKKERNKFYYFLKECLNLPFVKVIFSMRQDYLDCLLESTRFVTLDAINNDILSKDILYYLGNFTPAQAKAVIQSLTQRSQFYLEPALINRLVFDLTNDRDEIRPIELQVVGVQLQTQKITTLAQYLKTGPKEKLVAEFLEAVIKDCGLENENLAWMVLYCLTTERGTRPFKTRDQLLTDLAANPENLDLVLEILVKSGIVFLLREFSVDCYQLVHDYLVNLIRQHQEPELQTQLQLTKEQLKIALQKEQQERNRAEIAEIEALSSLSQVLWLSDDQLGALIAGIKAGQRLRKTTTPALLKQQTQERLRYIMQEIREQNRLAGHQGWVTQLCFSPDGTMLASASADHTVKLWRRNGELILTFAGHNDWVNSVSFSPDGTMLASAGWDKTAKIWHIDGSEIITLAGHQDRLFSISFSPNSQLIATASADQTVKLWQLDGTELATLTGHNGWVISVSFSPDGQTLATASADQTVKLWHLDSTLLATLHGHNERVWSVRFSPDGKLLASASADHTVKLWHTNSTEIATLVGHTDWVSSLSFSPDGQTLATGSWDNTVKLWQIDGTILTTFKGHRDKINSVAFSPDGLTLASAGADQIIRLWQLDQRCRWSIPAHPDRVMGVCFSPDGQTLASAGFDKTIKLWRTDGTELATFIGHQDWIKRVCFSPDGQLLASASADNTLKLWQLDGTELATFIGHQDWVNGVKFSPDGQLLASAGADNVLKLWYLDGTEVATLAGHSDKIWDLCFSPDGRLLASASWDGTIKLWNIEDLNTLSGEPIRTLAGHSDKVLSICFSPEGQKLASGSGDHTIKLWDLQGTLLATLAGHTAQVLSVQFSPNGELLASAGLDKTIKLWRNDTLWQTFPGHQDTITEICFSPDGKLLASAGTDRLIKLWTLERLEPQALELEELLKSGCAWLQNYLTTNLALSEYERGLCQTNR
jgi:WD40 repeat protein/tetratricopeptide (TPR) repeat protein